MAVVFRSEDHYDTESAFVADSTQRPSRRLTLARVSGERERARSRSRCIACFSSGNERYRYVTMRIVATRDDNLAAINCKYRPGAWRGAAARIPNMGTRAIDGLRKFRYRERVCFTVSTREIVGQPGYVSLRGGLSSTLVSSY